MPIHEEGVVDIEQLFLGNDEGNRIDNNRLGLYIGYYEKLYSNYSSQAIDKQIFIWDWFFYFSLAISFVVASLISFGVVRYYTSQNKMFKWPIYVPLFITFTLLFTSVSLLTLDISSTLVSGDSSKADKSLVVFWYIIYFSLQILSWLVLPLFGSYPYTGEFTVIRKILMAIVENLVFYIILGVVAGVGVGILLIYIAIYNAIFPDSAVVISFNMLVSFAVCLSNIAGLILFTIFIGYGLVVIPRRFWHRSNIERTIKWNCYKAVHMREKLKKEEKALAEIIVTAFEIKKLVSSEHKLYWYVNEIISTCELCLEEIPFLRKCVQSFDIRDCSEYNQQTVDKFREKGSSDRLIPNSKKEKVCTRSTCVKIHRELQRAIRGYGARKFEWTQLQKETFYYQDVARSCTLPTNHPQFKRRVSSLFGSQRAALNGLTYYYYKYVHWFAYRIFALILIPVAFLIFWSEFTPAIFGVTEEVHITLFGGVFRELKKNRIAVQLLSLFSLAAICYLMLGGMLRIKLFYVFRMVPYHTDISSLYLAASLICRAIPSLCFNFLQMLDMGDDGIDFYEVVGTLDMDSLKIFGVIGNFIVNYFPLLIVVVSFLSFFKVVERVAFCFKVKTNVSFWFFETKKTEETRRQGILLLRKKRINKVKKLMKIASQNEMNKENENAEIYEAEESNTAYIQMEDKCSK
ncbi:hypothetical protein ABK040_013735 [Willaertia magna]